MQLVVRAAVIYAFLLVVTRLSGRRTLGQMTTFDFVLLLVIGEATQQALLGNDFSVTTAAVLITSLVTIDIVISLLKGRWPRVARVVEGVPVVLVEDGTFHHDRMQRARVDEGDILEAARETHGLERMEQVRYAILERSGSISVVPRRS